MEKSEKLKNALVEMYKKRVWNKQIEIDGEFYIYISAKNEFRKIVNQPSGQVAILIGTMVFGRFTWCC